MPKSNTTKMKILKALMVKDPLTWSRLLERTTASKGALSNNLRALMKIGFVETEVDITHRPPITHYKLSDKFWVLQEFLCQSWA